MARQRITAEIAHAASWDAGNHQMRAAGRKKWSRADYNAAVAEYDRLFPLEAQYPWASPEQIAEMRAVCGH